MEWKDRTDERKKEALIFFKNQIPVHVVTKSDSWINGYITQAPQEDYFIILDRKQGITKVLYRMIKQYDNCFTEFIGDLNSLPLPDYLKGVQA